MNAERWARVRAILDDVLAAPEDARAAAIARACAGDAELRRQVESLIGAEGDIDGFLEPPPDPPDGSRAGDIPDDLRGWTRYEILEVIGRGGMASVYKARDPRLQRLVAVKVISGTDATTVQRFLHEAEAQARVEHDNVLKVYETGTIGAHHYIAMQYVAGPTLTGVRDETTLERKVRLMRDIAEGLHAAHRQGLIHRDIKPGNVLIERGDDGLKPYLLDFGLATELGAQGLTEDGVVIGTPRYMAPERVAHGAAGLDRRSDIYSLGATCYEFLSGVPPFGESAGLQVLVEVIRTNLTPIGSLMPSLPREIDAIVSKCLEPDPQRRYGSARELAEDFDRFLNGEPVLARPSGAVSRLARRARRSPRAAAAITALAALSLIAGGWSGYSTWRGTRQTALAQMLGQQMQDLEWMLRAAQMSPLHAIQAEKDEVRGRLARIEALVAREGSWARGPGNYAIGRGLLTIGDAARAREFLERAWDAGYRAPDAALALGLAHGEILRIESTRALRIAADAERAARLDALDRAHRQPALAFLEAGRAGALVPPPYVEALIAAHRGDTAAAIARADDASRRTPWLFEARLLIGHLELSAAVTQYHFGHTADAVARARAADTYYTEAHDIAPSAIDAYMGRCSVAGLLLHISFHRPAEGAEVPLERIEPCAQAVTVDPANSDAYRLYSEAIRYWGNTRVIRREDPGDAYARAEKLAQDAIERSGAAIEALAALAGVYMDRGWWESRTARDPRGSIDGAIAVFERVLAADPRHESAANEMGQTLQLRGRYEAANGLDPTPSFDRAIASYQRALGINPATMFHYSSMTRAARDRAAAQAGRGVDPVPALRAVLRFLHGLPPDARLPARAEATSMIEALMRTYATS